MYLKLFIHTNEEESEVAFREVADFAASEELPLEIHEITPAVMDKYGLEFDIVTLFVGDRTYRGLNEILAVVVP